MYRGEGEMTGVTSQRSHQLDEETVEMEIHHRHPEEEEIDLVVIKDRRVSMMVTHWGT